jgi:hypothetical protein
MNISITFIDVLMHLEKGPDLDADTAQKLMREKRRLLNDFKR